jgi:hypothetical protein
MRPTSARDGPSLVARVGLRVLLACRLADQESGHVKERPLTIFAVELGLSPTGLGDGHAALPAVPFERRQSFAQFLYRRDNRAELRQLDHQRSGSYPSYLPGSIIDMDIPTYQTGCSNLVMY